MKFDSLLKNRWLRRASVLLAALVVLWGLVWWAVPYVVKDQLQKKGSDALGRAVQVGQVEFHPWTLALTLSDLSIAQAGPAGNAAPVAPAVAPAASAASAAKTAAQATSQNTPAPMLHIQRVLLDVALWQSIRRLAPVVDAIAVDQPVLQITHTGDGHYDFDDILARVNTPPESTPRPTPAFAVYNITLTDGAIRFNDVPQGKLHALSKLHLALPFLSNLDSQREIKAEPRLAFTLNGSSFDSDTQTTPFAVSRKTDASFQLKNLDLAPYLPYLPASLPVKLQAAVLQAEVKLAFEQTPAISLRVSGTVQADHIRIANAQGADWLELDALKLAVDELRPLQRSAKIASIEIAAPRADVRRDAAGRLNLLADVPATQNVAASAGNTSASGTKDSKNTTKNAAKPEAAPAAKDDAGWTVSVAKLDLHDGDLRWADAATQPAAQLALRGLALEASAISWPFTQPLQFKGAAQVGEATAATAQLRFSGSATDQQAELETSLAGLPLAAVSPYLAAVLEPRLSGELSTDLQLQWKANGPLLLTAKQLTLDRLFLGESQLATNKKKPGSPDVAEAQTGKAVAAKNKADSLPPGVLATLRQLQLRQAQVDIAQRRISVAGLTLTEPHTVVSRGADQHWMYERWLKPTSAQTPATGAAASAGSAASTAPPTTATSAAPWAVSITQLALDGGAVSYLDQSTSEPVALEISALNLQIKDLVPGSAKASPLTVSARVAAGNTEPGRLSYVGTLALQPVAAQGQVELVHLPLHALEPYFGAALNVDIIRADTSFKGQANFKSTTAGTQLQVRGDGTLEEFRANRSATSTLPVASLAPANSASAPVAADTASSTPATPATPATPSPGRELLSWKLLNLRGLDVAVQPGAATRVEVKETALSDFYARVVVDETGRINLQDLVRPTPGAANTVAATAGTSSAAAPKDTQTPAAVPAQAADPGAPVVRIGAISLVNGRVLFFDRFVKPNYSANLSELTGKLGAFSSQPAQGEVQLADLELRGRAEGTAALEITGKLNPLAKPLALDIKAKVRDLELPALSPYSIRYVGHGIERGKMSVDVHYVVLPSGQLTASNSIILNQLTFGEAVPGAPTSLPVKLATALLADSNGVIDLNLPLSGSLNDPQFRIGPVIFKIIGNLIAKAITSPFSLLAHVLGGGGESLSEVPFPAGSAVLTPQAREGLDKVAKALNDRPALKMTVVGNASLQLEREAMQLERLQRRVLAEKRRNAVKDGSAASTDTDTDALQGLTVTSEEYPTLLKAVYQRASFPKPRNALGMLKDLPVVEMEQLMVVNLPVDDEYVQRLAVQRGVAVRDYLAAQKLPLDRLFLGAPKIVAAPADWHPQADLQLAAP